MKAVVQQVVLPITYKNYEDGKPISSELVRDRISLFLRKNLTKDLARRRDTFISHRHRMQFVAPIDFGLPSFRKSVRISSQTDALISEYAGIMQIPKRHVIWMAVALPDTQLPPTLPLEMVLRQQGEVNLSFIDVFGEIVRPA